MTNFSVELFSSLNFFHRFKFRWFVTEDTKNRRAIEMNWIQTAVRLSGEWLTEWKMYIVVAMRRVLLLYGIGAYARATQALAAYNAKCMLSTAPHGMQRNLHVNTLDAMPYLIRNTRAGNTNRSNGRTSTTVCLCIKPAQCSLLT